MSMCAPACASSPRTLARLALLVEAYGAGCFYCGAELPLESLTVDEYVPRARGGRRTVANQRPACFPCNNAKGDSDPEEWLAARAAPPAPPPRPLRTIRAAIGPFGAHVRAGVGCPACVIHGRWGLTRDECAACGTRYHPSMFVYPVEVPVPDVPEAFAAAMRPILDATRDLMRSFAGGAMDELDRTAGDDGVAAWLAEEIGGDVEQAAAIARMALQFATAAGAVAPQLRAEAELAAEADRADPLAHDDDAAVAEALHEAELTADDEYVVIRSGDGAVRVVPQPEPANTATG